MKRSLGRTLLILVFGVTFLLGISCLFAPTAVVNGLTLSLEPFAESASAPPPMR